jgi:hypothetical protein
MRLSTRLPLGAVAGSGSQRCAVVGSRLQPPDNSATPWSDWDGGGSLGCSRRGGAHRRGGGGGVWDTRRSSTRNLPPGPVVEK